MPTDKAQPPASHPLAVVGIGCVFPKAKTLREYWANIKNATDAIRDVPPSHWRPEDYFDKDPKKPDHVYAYKGGFLEPYDFDPAEFGLAPNTLEATDPAQLFGLVAAKMALADAGYPVEEDWDKSRVSVILGVTGTLELVVPLGARLGHPHWRKALSDAGVPPAQAEEVVERIADSYVPWQESSFPGLLGNVIAGRIANRFNLGGTNCTVDAACGSSLSAAHMAALELQTGRAKMVVTGGVDAFNDIFMYMCFTKTPALSVDGHAKSFDAAADGTTLGEGVGMVVLKRLDEAQKDGDRIYAILRGIGSSSDGKGKSIYAPSAEGQTRALQEAYRVADVSPGTVELVEAHGTGTTVGDGIEVEALTSVYQAARGDGTWCALGSVKSMIGHTKAAAGSASLIKTVLALHHKVFPPTIKVTEPLAVLAKGDSPFYLSLEKRPWLRSQGHPRRAACSALGFGGANFHAVLEEHSPEKTATDWDGDCEIIAVAGKDAADLSVEIEAYAKIKVWDELRIAANASRAGFDVLSSCRLIVVVEKSSNMTALFAKAILLLSSNAGKSAWSSPEGVYYGCGKPGKLGVLFPGQGAQYVGMGRDLVCQFPEAFAALEEADAVFEGSQRLSEFMFPKPGWKPEQKQRQEEALRSTDVAQPALGAAALAAWRVLQTFSVKADAFAGHSYGELVALHAAGRFDSKTLHALSGLRGRLMKGDGSDKGVMLAVQASFSEVEKAVLEEKLDLVIANRNAPAQNVLSGATTEIEKAEKLLTERGWGCRRLPVAAAFHSALVAPALEPFGKALGKAPFVKSDLVVYANTTGRPYPSEPDQAREILAHQLAKPVEFVKLVSAMHNDGVRTFLEVGAGARLSGLVELTLKDKDFTSVGVDASNGRKSAVADLARSLAQLAALGHAVDLKPWQGGAAGLNDVRSKPKMSVTLTGAGYRSTPHKQFAKRQPESAPSLAPACAAPAGDGSLLNQTLRAAQSSIDVLTRLQEQTAALHLQFLQGQESAQRSVQALVEQQQALYSLMSGSPVAFATPVPTPRAPVLLPAPVEPQLALERVAISERTSATILPTLLAIVSEKTGYPAETINPDMDLEGDLGIDSIKRVEILAAVAEKLPGAPKVKPEHLGILRTLKSIAEHLSQEMPSSPVEPKPAPAPILATLLAVVSEKTGYPADTIDPTMDLEGDLGIDSIKRVEILSALAEKLPGAPKVKPEHLGTLRTLQSIADYLCRGGAPAVAAAAAADVALPVEGEGPCVLQRFVPELVLVGPRDFFPLDKFLAIAVTCDSGLDLALVREFQAKGLKAEVVSLDDPKALPRDLGALIVVAPSRPAAAGCPWTAQSEAWLKKAFLMVQAAGRSFESRGARGLVAGVTRLDGALGFEGREHDPSFAGLAGLLKSAAREWHQVRCRAIDADPSLGVDAAAALLVKELACEGPVETALSEGGARVVTLVDRVVPSAGREPLAPEDVVIVTGGARGVTSEAALALAKAFKPRLVLVGRSPLPDEEPAYLAAALTEAELRTVVAAEEKGLSPKSIGARARDISAAREIRRTLRRLAEAGVEARYRVVDVRDAQAVRVLVSETVRDLGPVRGIVHGAGVLADKKALDKTPENLDAVLDTKLSGLRHLLDAVKLRDLRLLTFFSSSSARYGRVGQSDYALANEVLNKAAQVLARRLPDCRVASLGWGPWDGGMVDASLKGLFAAEGVGVISLAEGGAHLVAEIRACGAPAETVVIAALPGAKAGLPIAFERDLCLETHPFLAAHVINGRAVLPLAMTAEWLAHGALHGHPGLAFAGFDDLRVTKGVAVTAGRTATIKAHAGAAERRDGFFVVSAQIRGEKGALHASARVLLAAKRPSAPAASLIVKGPAYGRKLERAYREILFHGHEFQNLLGVTSCGPEGVVAETKTALPPSSWMRAPLRDRWTLDPAALDAAFQAMILWTVEEMGAPSLPAFIGRYRQYAEFPERGVRVVARASRRGEALAGADIEFLDERGALIARMDGCECAVDAALKPAFRRNVAEAAA